MAKTIAELRQALTEISRQLCDRKHDESLSLHDRHAIEHAESHVDSARSSLFNCESQS